MHSSTKGHALQYTTAHLDTVCMVAQFKEVVFVFIDTFKTLCSEKGVSLSRALLDLDMSKGSIARWKDGGEPSNSSKLKIADYFGITVQELNSGEIKIPPTVSDEGDVTQAMKLYNALKSVGIDVKTLDKAEIDRIIAHAVIAINK